MVDNKKVFGALLTDLSKAINCLSHELIIAKLNAYSFCLPELRLIHDCFSNRQQRTKINQESVLGPTLFNIFLTEFFLIIVEAEFASYADNNILYDAGNTAENVMLSLQEPFKSLFK